MKMVTCCKQNSKQVLMPTCCFTTWNFKESHLGCCFNKYMYPLIWTRSMEQIIYCKHLWIFANRNFHILPIKSLFANIWIREVAGKCIENIQVYLRMSKIKTIREMINSRHSDLTKYRENITSHIISTFKVSASILSIFIFLYSLSYCNRKISDSLKL